MKILIIGDSHVAAGQNLRRFAALKNYLRSTNPDVVVSIGDFLTLDSLSEWDRNKRGKMEGRRYETEIRTGNDALDLIDDGCDKTLKIFIKGNHENRLDRYLDHDPTMKGIVSIEKDLQLKKRGWKVVEYKDDIVISGISFTHVPISGSGKPIGNPNVTGKALALYSNSVVFGHTHTLNHTAEHRRGAPHLNQALAVGCFFEHIDDYAKGSKTDYWRGVVMLDAYHKNRFDIQTKSMSNLLREYGPKTKKS
jgi:predicted phosphodiesterase